MDRAAHSKKAEPPISDTAFSESKLARREPLAMAIAVAEACAAMDPAMTAAGLEVVAMVKVERKERSPNSADKIK